MAGKPYAYSITEIETLLRLRAEGIGYKVIARQYPTKTPRGTPRSPEAIRSWFYRYFQRKPQR